MRRLLLRSAGSTLLATAAGLALAQNSTPPNILIVILDDVGVDQFSSYGEAGACSTSQAQCFSDGDCPSGQSCIEDYAITPRIDQIAEEGVLFRNAYAAPTCKPSRAAALSGRYGFRNGVIVNQDDFPASERTIAEALKDPTIVPTAYATAAFGKWGLGNNPSPNVQGFDGYAGSLGGGGGGGGYFSWTRNVNGTNTDCSPGSQACPDVSYKTSVNVNDALDWLGSQTGPWFLWLAFNAPHSPFHVPPHELVSEETLARLPTNGMGDPADPGTVCSGAQRRVCYMAALEAADAELARLLDAVPDNTWLIVLGDNGTPAGVTQSPFVSSKGSVYDGGLNVPFIVRAPDMTSAGSESAALIHVVDLFSTAIEIAGGIPPADRRLDSLSLVPIVDEPTLTMRPRGYAEGDGGQVARNERFKLIRRSGSEEFYDLEGSPPTVAGDPFEQNDLLMTGALDPEQQSAYDALSIEIDGVAIASGRVPDGRLLPGNPMAIARTSGGQLELSWTGSCDLGDVDYAVYEGTLGLFDSHGPILCSTDGVPFATFDPQAASAYYLVVPNNGSREGSYGTSSAGVPRKAAATPCLPQSHAGCE